MDKVVQLNVTDVTNKIREAFYGTSLTLAESGAACHTTAARSSGSLALSGSTLFSCDSSSHTSTAAALWSRM